MSLMKSSAARQKVCLLTALASLNNGHSSDLHACCMGMRFSSRPSFVPIKPLRPRSTAWRFSLVANLSSTAPERAIVVEVEARVVVGCYRMAVLTLVRSLIWPYNNFVLSCCTNSFLVSPSLALKPMRRRLNLCSSSLGVSTRVSTAWLTTWCTFLAIIVVHLGSSADANLAVTIVTILHSISWLTARLPLAARDAMFLMATSMSDNCTSTCELFVLRPMIN